MLEFSRFRFLLDIWPPEIFIAINFKIAVFNVKILVEVDVTSAPLLTVADVLRFCGIRDNLMRPHLK